MSMLSRYAAVLASMIATSAAAQASIEGTAIGSAPEKPSWDFAITAYPTQVRGGENSTSAIAVADRGALHLEARYGYEAIDSRSVFAGWTFSGGETFAWELTPLLGGAWGPVQAFVPGLEFSVSWKQLDFYIEAEFVRDRHATENSYNYAWSELGFRPIPWLRLGAVGQRTRAYGNARDFQRGPFVQATFGPATLGAFWFNPGSKDQVFVGSIGVAF
jgi:hypothetical protein